MPPSPQADTDLGARLEALGSRLGERESAHALALDEARGTASRLHQEVASALVGFHASAAAAGAPHLRVELSPVRVDDKHLRAVEFDLVRGRHKAVITAKSKGEVTLVGPFRIGKDEGPCLSFPFFAKDEIRSALASFLERFLEEAATP
jgi:hypothetical protein